MNRNGFTLIEMLITVSIFGLAMSVLLGGLRVGANSKLSVEQLLDSAYDERVGFSILRDDISCAVLEEGNEAITFNASGGGSLLAFYRFAYEGRLQHIEYVLESDMGSKRLIRLVSDVVLDTPLGQPIESTVFTGLSEVELSFFDGKGWRGSWGKTDALPQRVRIEGEHLQGEDSIPFEMTVSLPASEFFGGDDGD